MLYYRSSTAVNTDEYLPQRSDLTAGIQSGIARGIKSILHLSHAAWAEYCTLVCVAAKVYSSFRALLQVTRRGIIFRVLH